MVISIEIPVVWALPWPAVLERLLKSFLLVFVLVAST